MKVCPELDTTIPIKMIKNLGRINDVKWCCLIETQSIVCPYEVDFFTDRIILLIKINTDSFTHHTSQVNMAAWKSIYTMQNCCFIYNIAHFLTLRFWNGWIFNAISHQVLKKPGSPKSWLDKIVFILKRFECTACFLESETKLK